MQFNTTRVQMPAPLSDFVNSPCASCAKACSTTQKKSNEWGADFAWRYFAALCPRANGPLSKSLVSRQDLKVAKNRKVGRDQKFQCQKAIVINKEDTDKQRTDNQTESPARSAVSAFADLSFSESSVVNHDRASESARAVRSGRLHSATRLVSLSPQLPAFVCARLRAPARCLSGAS
jgi:hypothetical protein